MSRIPYERALIIGAGTGISAALTRQLRAAGLAVALAARDTEKLAGLVQETGARAFSADAADPASVEALFRKVDEAIGAPDVVIYNASGRVRGPLAQLDPASVRQSLEVTAFGGFLAVREAAKRMEPQGQGAILITGASASIKGFAQSAPFAMGKFALRGLAQSAARELGPKGIHVAHINIDGGVRSAARPEPAGAPDSMLDPEAIAETYLDLLRQKRSAWSFEVELRPWVETF
ncbi:MAG TPA: SDR family NAD(P)-dependent oxidoreductase [Acidisoma sp.]|uniref:SDR family NAD(P)-dependent oxidoreductase n=1 Tax=Acidisoma sp. TaxID=1872115 RepID=UPI002D15D18D|nr:SDR family NAD(P)-dependent oxidoreductase [Acidisoma sp.]HTI01235.1 SDR family NAD(P)-dependent oxidoreductase [Acidisoma sp.]